MHAQYIIGVCTGSWVLAGIPGILEGKAHIFHLLTNVDSNSIKIGRRATTNKYSFKEVKVELYSYDSLSLLTPTSQRTTSSDIQWVPKARWVVDGNIWTSSGVTAGLDMAYAFLKVVAGEGFAAACKNLIELRAAGAEDDEFADVFGLV